MPSAGLVQNALSMFGESGVAQIAVQRAEVNITNISVVGTGGDMSCVLWLAGIFYGSGSSGNVNRVRASNQIDSTCGVGVWAENANTPNETVMVQNSTVYNADSAGIFAGSGAPPTLSAQITSNVVSTSAAVAAIDSDSVNGQVNGNDVSNSVFGVYDVSKINVETNTIMGASFGIFLGDGGTSLRQQDIGLERRRASRRQWRHGEQQYHRVEHDRGSGAGLLFRQRERQRDHRCSDRARCSPPEPPWDRTLSSTPPQPSPVAAPPLRWPRVPPGSRPRAPIRLSSGPRRRHLTEREGSRAENRRGSGGQGRPPPGAKP